MQKKEEGKREMNMKTEWPMIEGKMAENNTETKM